MTRHFFQTIHETLARNLPLVLVRIIAQAGSAPRTAGARMMVFPDGSLWGTVGGGEFEGKAISAARAMLEAMTAGQSPQGEILRFSLSGATDMDMICGGSLILLLEPLRPDTPEAALFAEAQNMEANGRAFSFITRLPLINDANSARIPQRTLLPEGASATCKAALPEAVTEHAYAALARHSPSHLMEAEGFQWFIEPFRAREALFLLGAGHVALHTAKLGSMVGFNTAVLDDRAEFAAQSRFPEARITVLPDLSEHAVAAYFDAYPPGGEDAIVILTRGHAHDRDALAASLRTGAGYVGMIGSRGKRDQIFSHLQSQGFAPETLARVHSPVGLPIHAETPEEIAVSIMAELIQWRRTKV